MRFACLLVALAACAVISTEPGDDDGSGSGSGSGSGKMAVCGQERDCTPDDNGCASYPYESLPSRCYDICYRGRCCEQYEGAWHLVVYDCARPIYDGGIDYDAGYPDAP